LQGITPWGYLKEKRIPGDHQNSLNRSKRFEKIAQIEISRRSGKRWGKNKSEKTFPIVKKQDSQCAA
jgi:hypothetical protein